jgi:hypothetical protein
VERVNVEAVAELAREPRDVGIHARDEDRHLRMLDRTGTEERRHQRVLVELALEVELGAVLPAVPDRSQSEDDLAELFTGRLPLDAEASLVVPLDLRAKAEDEPAARIRLQVPGDVGENHGCPGEGDGNRSAERDPSSGGGDRGQREKRIVLRLDGPYAVEAYLLEETRLIREALEGARAEHGVDLHAPSI